MISKTKVKNRAKRKNDPEIVETVRNANDNPEWRKIAQILSGGRKNYSVVNLNRIENVSKIGDTVVVPGKVLGVGELTKKIRICALSFSESAKEKLKSVKTEMVSVLE